MSSGKSQRSRDRRERRATEAFVQDQLREAERQRVAGLTLYELIEEVCDMEDVRQVLHLIADKAGIE